MKFLFLIVAFAMFFSVQGLTEEQKTKLRAYSKECVEKTSVDKDLVKKWRENDYSHEDENLKKYVYCMMHKAGFMDDEGKIKKDVAVNKVEDAVKEKVAAAVDACADKIGETKYETAWLMAKCYNEVRPDHDIF